jgi:hypothetical protein
MVIYTQSTECSAIQSPTSQDNCDTATEVPEKKACKYIEKQGDVEAHCEIVNTPEEPKPNTSKKSSTSSAKSSTNSSDILNIFKITLALLIVFTIL